MPKTLDVFEIELGKLKPDILNLFNQNSEKFWTIFESLSYDYFKDRNGIDSRFDGLENVAGARFIDDPFSSDLSRNGLTKTLRDIETKSNSLLSDVDKLGTHQFAQLNYYISISGHQQTLEIVTSAIQSLKNAAFVWSQNLEKNKGKQDQSHIIFIIDLAVAWKKNKGKKITKYDQHPFWLTVSKFLILIEQPNNSPSKTYSKYIGI
jgi:hypothetical protein